MYHQQNIATILFIMYYGLATAESVQYQSRYPLDLITLLILFFSGKPLECWVIILVYTIISM